MNSSAELLSALRPTRVGRDWRYSLVMTQRHSDLLRYLRTRINPTSPRRSEEWNLYSFKAPTST